jgi:TPR repeat protein
MVQAEIDLGNLAFQAEGGDAGAQYRLGVLFLLGDSVEQDLEAANRWLTRAAARQYPGALSLAEKLAAWSQLESEREKKSIRILARAWIKSRSSAAFRFYRDAIRSIHTSLLRVWTGRVWKIQAQDLIANVCFQPQVEASELPTRRRERFQFRDSA